jgi:putative DNA primase/helicase
MVFRMMMIASVARIETPGCKFDYACILEGGQGIGKSTTIKLIYGEDYFGELDADLADRKATAEQIAGKWGTEMPEMSAFSKAEHTHAKGFMRRQHDDVRMAYDRSTSELPRQCVIWGTTNDEQVLRDSTGNRSYWIIKCGDKLVNFRAMLREMDHIWAQAVHEHDVMRAKYPKGDMPLTLSGEALKVAIGVQETARQKEMWEDWTESFDEWAPRPVALGSLLIDMGADFDELDAKVDGNLMVYRAAFTQRQAMKGALDRREPSTPTEQGAWNKAKQALMKRGYTERRCRVAGVFGRWIFPPNMTEEDQLRGYVETGGADAPETGERDNYDDLI